jgi:hypothetical protein
MIYFVVQARAYLWPTMGLAGWLAAAAAASFPAASRTQKERATDALCTEQRKRREEERRKSFVFHCKILKHCRTDTLVTEFDKNLP